METPQDLRLLVEKAQQGNRAAFEAAIGRLRARLEGFVRTRVGGHLASEIDIEDVLQETYTQALKSISCFRWSGSDSLLRWLNSIAEHVIVSSARRQRKHTSRILYVERDIHTNDPAPSKVLRREERFRRLQEALNSLPTDYREAIYLTRIQGLPVKEAAERMKRTPKAVMHLLARGLKKLKGSFGDTESLNLPADRLKGPGEANGA